MLQNWINDALQLNRQICYIMSEINGTNHLFEYSNLSDLDKKYNIRLLLRPDQISMKVDLNTHTHLVKQRSVMWFQLRNQARITESTIYNRIVLDSLKKQKEHYNEFIKGLPPKEHSADVKAYMKHGKDNENHGVATLTGIFMPAFMLPCCKFIEDGANFIHGKDTHRLL